MINRYSKLDRVNQDIGFKDAGDISEYAIAPIQALAYLGIVNGYDNQIRPHRNATREEAAVMLYRLLTEIQRI